MVPVPLKIVKPGLRIAQSVFVDKTKLLGKDTVLDVDTINQLINKGIRTVWLYEEDIDPALIPDTPQNLYKELTNTLETIRKKVLTEANFEMVPLIRLIKRVVLEVKKKYRPFTEMIRVKNSERSVIDHMADVCIISAALGTVNKMSFPEIELVSSAGLLHDIGMFFIPESIIKKSDKLNDEDNFLLMKHTIIGRDLLAEIRGINPTILAVVAQHHEKLDGSGYPYGLTDDRIDKCCRMVTIADTYCNLANEHPGGSNLPCHEVAEYLSFQGGSGLDKGLVELFLNEIMTYPLQSTVRLNNGTTARVVLQNRGFPTRPVVKAGKDKIDLSTVTTIFIEKILELPKDDPNIII